jgi:hypothetical protein
MWPFPSRRRTTDWREFEEVAADRLLKHFADYYCAPQKVSRNTRKRPDLFLRSKTNGDRIIVDFKWSLRPTDAHLKQVSAYKGYPFFAQRGILIYPKNARVPEDFEKKAAARKIEIRRDALSKKRKGVFKRLLRAIARKR